ncbi:hypothetical protein L6164_029186 [Bauhinia variegata]|uniref:Uncharacterized protein n=1 Tax=Bauhinia variegata TaxID=167791 RepID=A0ACB9L8Y8_BAUVA|nr:hypothetical protein L6164_029186 [Bauhinia variegata]
MPTNEAKCLTRGSLNAVVTDHGIELLPTFFIESEKAQIFQRANFQFSLHCFAIVCKVVDMVEDSSKRKRPNILVTGTPGTGKTTTSAALAEATRFRHINIGELVKEKNLHEGWDDDLDCYIINEDLVCDELENSMEEGGNILDYHGCDFFPERWFDCVVVLQTDNSLLYDRLVKRGYTESKLSNNVECEIFQVLLEEAKESYPEDRVVALKSDTIEDISRNVSTDRLGEKLAFFIPMATKLMQKDQCLVDTGVLCLAVPVLFHFVRTWASNQ